MTPEKRKIAMIILTTFIILFLIIGLVAFSFAVVGKVKDNKLMVAISLGVILGTVIVEVILGSLCNKKIFPKEEKKIPTENQLEQERRKDLFTEEKIEGAKNLLDEEGGSDESDNEKEL